jgi:3-hydroxyisobutyrate dehydrogenase-like beta-hydroxyacid dehydrogenase/pimeloyl-ACP methyl ester carboxylesterase
MPSRESVAVLGLGAMGSRIAARLLESGRRVVVWNRTADRTDELTARGAETADTPALTVDGVDVVVTMLADPDALLAVVLGRDGVADGLRAGQTLVEMSTVGPTAVARVRDVVPAGVAVVDAPVLGSIGEAERGSLVLFVGAEEEDAARVQPLLAELGDAIHVGGPGAGAAAKLVANSTLFGSVSVLGEALALADHLGLERDAAFAVLSHTPMAAQAERRREALERASYPRRFALSLARKDAALVADAGADLRVAQAALSWLDQAEAAGAGGSDYTAVLQMIIEPSEPWSLERRWRSEAGVVAYDVLGSGEPVVLVHGTPSSSYLWRHVARALARSHTVHLYDLPGYGSSEMSEGQDVSLGAQGRVLRSLLEHWGLKRPTIVAHDFGGATTLRAHLLEQCEFERIVLLDPVALAPWGSPFFRLVRENVEVFQQLPAAIHRAVVAAYLRGAFHRPMSDAQLAPFLRPWHGDVGQRAFYRQIQQADQRFTDDIEPLYGEIRAPVDILWGADDAWIAPETAARLQSRIPGSTLRLIDSAGHFLQEDAPAAVSEAILEVLERGG